ncbi:Protein CBG05582 [Caenorhabditis briggsae]|uniref:phospholipase A2 n=1 Tax=Caenorhabditis briggsae TaxID=6238 RepID=A8X073_CAEBR|nr:Protein CBG05582 [Caenorhabditis briggsae]CAP26033.2 Protein CBG05582 [Caenorhabditis briggsae]
MAFTGLNWDHVKTTFWEANKMLDSMVTMIARSSGSRESSAESRSSGSSSDGALVAGPNGKLVMLKRKSTDEDEEDGAAMSKKPCLESDSASESSEAEDAKGSIRFLSSLTNVIMRPAQKATSTYSGADEWVPKEMEEIAEFPLESIDKYKKVHPNAEAPKKFMLVNGEFAVVASLEKLTEEQALRAQENSPHQHKHHDSREERLTKNELTDNEDQKKKKERDFRAKEEEEAKKGEKVLYHLAITLFNENKEKYVMSLFRSHKLADVVALCERCRENPELFRVFPKNVNIKEYLHLIFMELRDNMTWKSVHISSKIGLLEFFENMRSHKLQKYLNLIVQPEGLSPLMIAIQNDQQETVRWMVEHGADLNTITSDGQNVLHMAATISNGEILKFLWDTNKCEAMINKTDVNGSTPAYSAFSSACITNWQMLRGHGGALQSTESTTNATPFIGAMKRGKLDEASLKKMLEQKADGLQEVESTTGNSVIHFASNKKCLILLMEKFRDQTDPEARNKFQQTPLHTFVINGELGLVMTLCAYGVEKDAQDVNGNTPLHCAVTRGFTEIARMLLCLGAKPDLKNRYKESPRHLAARLTDKEAKMDIVRALIICGAPACDDGFVGCAFGCMHNRGLTSCKTQLGSSSSDEQSMEERVKDIHVSENAASAPYEFVLDPDTQLVEEAYAERSETRAYPHEMALERVKNKLKDLIEKKKTSNVINVLGLDGGGIRGLVTVQMLICLESYLDRPLIDYFDWIGATSTGCYIMSTLMTGGSLRHAQQYYLMFKDQLFDSWTRPYDTKTLETFIKRSFGADRLMGDIKYPRFFCTTVRADTFPVQLDLARNYRLPISDKENKDLGFTDPMGTIDSTSSELLNCVYFSELSMWRAVRRSSAAPTYFSASEGKFIDGGMISNNPVLDLMSEICFWNTTCQKQQLIDKIVDVGCVLSVGTGITPICPVDPSVFEMNDWLGMLRGIKNLSLVVIDQATATEGAPITRSRSWCHSLGIPYYRLNAPIFKDVILDTNDDYDLAKIMWDSVVYSHTHKKDFQELAELLKTVGTVDERKELLKI